MNDSVTPDWDILSLADHIELVNDLLIHEAEGLAAQELKRLHELLGGDVLWDHQLRQIHSVRSKEAWFSDFLLLANLEEVFESSAWVHLAIPELHAGHHVAEIRQCQGVCVTLTHSEEVGMHLTGNVVISHWQLSVFIQLNLISLNNVFGNDTRPLILHSDLPLHVA